MGLFLHLVILAWVPFRWELPAAFEFWGALFDWSSAAIRYRRLFVALPVLLGSLVIDYLQYHTQDEFVYLNGPVSQKLHAWQLS
jgi:hypothetical protein